ncbi:MAG: hypothetical protein WBD05_10355 [Phycisphaerae bacterium]
MSRPVELIIGPARSGKASRILRAYLDAYAEAGPGRCLMLVPTALRRRATESRLLAAQSAGVLVRLALDHLAVNPGAPCRTGACNRPSATIIYSGN